MHVEKWIHTYIKWWQCSVTAAFVSFVGKTLLVNSHFFHFSFSTSWSLVIPKGSSQLSLPVLSQLKSSSITVKRFSSIHFEISVIHLCFRVRSTYLVKHLLVSSARAGCKIKDWLPCTKTQCLSEVMLLMLLAGRNAWQNVCAQVISGQTSVSSVSGGLQRKASWYNYDVMSVLCELSMLDLF